MKIRYIVGLAVVAMLVIPGTASEFAAIGAQPHAASTATPSVFNDPNATPTLSITLPTKFVAVDLNPTSPQGFKL
jgi:hypothetical protein